MFKFNQISNSKNDLILHAFWVRNSGDLLWIWKRIKRIRIMSARAHTEAHVHTTHTHTHTHTHTKTFTHRPMCAHTQSTKFKCVKILCASLLFPATHHTAAYSHFQNEVSCGLLACRGPLMIYSHALCTSLCPREPDPMPCLPSELVTLSSIQWLACKHQGREGEWGERQGLYLPW